MALKLIKPIGCDVTIHIRPSVLGIMHYVRIQITSLPTYFVILLLVLIESNIESKFETKLIYSCFKLNFLLKFIITSIITALLSVVAKVLSKKLAVFDLKFAVDEKLFSFWTPLLLFSTAWVAIVVFIFALEFFLKVLIFVVPYTILMQIVKRIFKFSCFIGQMFLFIPLVLGFPSLTAVLSGILMLLFNVRCNFLNEKTAKTSTSSSLCNSIICEFPINRPRAKFLIIKNKIKSCFAKLSEPVDITVNECIKSCLERPDNIENYGTRQAKTELKNDSAQANSSAYMSLSELRFHKLGFLFCLMTCLPNILFTIALMKDKQPNYLYFDPTLPTAFSCTLVYFAHIAVELVSPEHCKIQLANFKNYDQDLAAKLIKWVFYIGIFSSFVAYLYRLHNLLVHCTVLYLTLMVKFVFINDGKISELNRKIKWEIGISDWHVIFSWSAFLNSPFLDYYFEFNCDCYDRPSCCNAYEWFVSKQ